MQQSVRAASARAPQSRATTAHAPIISVVPPVPCLTPHSSSLAPHSSLPQEALGRLANARQLVRSLGLSAEVPEGAEGGPAGALLAEAGSGGIGVGVGMGMGRGLEGDGGLGMGSGEGEQEAVGPEMGEGEGEGV